jgi:hypothetical protein
MMPSLSTPNASCITPARTTAVRKPSNDPIPWIATATIVVRPAAGPLTLTCDCESTPTTTPPMMPAITPEKSGALDPSAMPRQSGNATRNTTIPAGPSYLNHPGGVPSNGLDAEECIATSRCAVKARCNFGAYRPGPSDGVLHWFGACQRTKAIDAVFGPPIGRITTPITRSLPRSVHDPSAFSHLGWAVQRVLLVSRSTRGLVHDDDLGSTSRSPRCCSYRHRRELAL